MNKKVFISMLVLTISFLVSFYVLKIFFPQEFMLAIQNENLIKIGSFVDKHIWLRYICAFITSFITYWLFCCICSQRLYLNWKECIIILVASILVKVTYDFDANISTHLGISMFFILPFITKGKVGIMALTYTTHGLAQVLSLAIISLPMYLVNANYITILLMGFESYFWLILCYIIFNYKKEQKNDKI